MATNLVSNAIVHEVLTKDNYANWSACIKNYLLGQDLWDVVEIESRPVKNEAELKTRRKKNAMALHAIQISCGPSMLSRIRDMSSAKAAWDELAKMHKPQPKGRVSKQVRSSGNPGTENSDSVLNVKIRNAVYSGNWKVAEGLFKDHKIPFGAKISCTGNTALHAATIAGQVKIVEKLVLSMSNQDLEIQEADGWTALMIAALIGITQMAKCMVEKNTNLLRIVAKNGMIPVVVASAKGHKEMVRYLNKHTPDEELTGEKEANGATLLSNCIVGKLFDVALDRLQRCPCLAFVQDKDGHSSPVYVLAQMPSAFPSGNRFVLWQRWIYSCLCVQRPHASNDTSIDMPEPNQGQTDRRNIAISVFGQFHGLLSNLLKLFDPGFKQIHDRKLMHVQAHELLCCICKEIPNLTDPQRKEGLVYKAIFQAVKLGIVEFVDEITKADLDLLRSTDTYLRGIFQCAVVYRQEKIFSLIYRFDKRTNSLTSGTDQFKNNMLHLAGMLAPSTRLDHISGAALQMQRELQWFKEVERIVPPKFKEELNLDGKMPRELFTENHMNLVKEGEKWMKEIATSCTVVAALIVTIMFAAAFTVPGGNHQDTGSPMFLSKKLFRVFIVSDVISFFSSSTSVLTFLGILTSRYAEEYFLKSLPRKMIIGLTTLFISIASMIIAFCAALFLMLEGHLEWVFIPIILLASVPVTLFVLLQFPLLVEIFISTYGSSIFNRKRKFPFLVGSSIFNWKRK